MKIDLSPGIKEPLCGYPWVWQHAHDLDGWHPVFEVITPTSHTTVTIKSDKVIKELVKTLKGSSLD